MLSAFFSLLLPFVVAGDVTDIEARHRESNANANASDERVVMWNTITQRKQAGNSAPRRVHLQQYLQDHPEYEVYSGQNLPGGSLSKSPKSLVPSAEDDARFVWGALEDAELARLVREDGPGSWAAKASVFSTGRSASAIRMRWIKLEEDAEQAGTTAGEMRIRVWNRATQRLTAGNSAPRRENLERFMEEHPEYIVHSDPGGTKAGGASHAVASPKSSTSRPERREEEDEARVLWTPEEDAELAKLINMHGVGDWASKAARFSTARSANSLRKRWSKLEDEGASKFVTKLSDGQERVKVWNTRTHRALAGMSTSPQRHATHTFELSPPNYLRCIKLCSR